MPGWGLQGWESMSHTSEQVWQDYHTRLHQFILGRVNCNAEAEDILQDVFLRIHRSIDALGEADRLQSWIYRIARNAVIDYYRQRRTTEELPPDLRARDTDDTQAHREIEGCLAPMIGALPDRYRRAMQFTELDGLTQKELAKKEGLSLSGAKSRVQRGRVLIKNMLLDCCQFEFDRQGQIVDYSGKSEVCSPRCDSCR